MQFKLRLFAMCAAINVLAACATAPPPVDPVAVPALNPEVTFSRPAPETLPAAPEASFKPLAVAVVVSSRSSDYEAVADALSEQFDALSIYDLSDKSQPPVSAFRLINDTDIDVVIAIGLRAARSAVAMSGVPVVFSQVFNYQDHDLLTDNSRGVEAVAPMDAQLDAWKEAVPTLQSIGLVIGPGHEQLIEQARLAAGERGLQLIVQEARSDQEALYHFKRMVRDIDGFWLLPDNRVLSTRVLKEMIDQANRQNVSVLVPNPSMLSIGASISVSTVASDIAKRIGDIVDRIQQGEFGDIEPMTPLSEISVHINDARLRQQLASSRISVTRRAGQ